MKAAWSEERHGYERSGRIVLRWTCCDACHSEHKSLMVARLHWVWLQIKTTWSIPIISNYPHGVVGAKEEEDDA
jgi:hypothetical protein